MKEEMQHLITKSMDIKKNKKKVENVEDVVDESDCEVVLFPINAKLTYGNILFTFYHLHQTLLTPCP